MCPTGVRTVLSTMSAATSKPSLPRRLVRLAPWVIWLGAFLALVGYLHREAYLQQLERNLMTLPGGAEWWQEASQWAEASSLEEPRAIIHGRVVRVIRSYPDGRPPQLQAVELDRVLVLQGDRFWRREPTLYINLREGHLATPSPPVAGDWWTTAILRGTTGTTRAWMALPTPRQEDAEPAG